MVRTPVALRMASLILLVLLLATPAWSDVAADKQKAIADLEAKIKQLNADLEKLKTPSEETKPVEGIPPQWLSALSWRSIGPATMGGRITAISVFEADPSTYWVATASGGLLKTENNGTTFKHQFDKESTVSIGHVCVAPSDKNIVWVGTGEANPRNSVSYGDGVYKSTDGGATWKNMGLRASYQIGKIVVHPKDPNIVYVGALGRCYGPNPERGVFKSADGGVTWDKVLFFDDNTGCIDLMMHPEDPNILIAGMWERKRDGFDSYVGERPPDGIDGYDPIVKWGQHGGLYRTTDAGKNWKKLDKGLPTVKTGRIGLDWYRKNPSVVFATIDSENVGKGQPPKPVPYLGFTGEDAEPGMKLLAVVENQGAAKAGLKVDDIVLEADDKKVEGYDAFTKMIQAKKVGDEIKLKIKRGNEVLTVSAKLGERPAGGGRFGGGGRGGPQLGLGFQAGPADKGVKVAGIEKDAANAKAGLAVDDVILTVDDKEFADTRELSRILNTDRKAGDKVKVTVERGGEKKTLQLTLEQIASTRGGASATRPYAAQLYGQRENVQGSQGPEGFQTGGIYKSTDGGESWTRINSINQRPMYFSVVRVDPTDDQKLYSLGTSVYASTDGGKSFKAYGNNGVHPDQHAMWINPKDSRHMLIGTDGGFYVTYDRMATWEHLALAAMGQFYHVALDNRKPYNVYGGLQDNGSWGGPSRTLRGTGPVNEDWISVSGGDGFVCRVDPDDPDVVYAESQDGNVMRRNLRTGEGGSVRPRAQGTRFNWNTPYILSSHNPRIVYVGGDKVYRSLKQGADMKPISPEITKTKRGTATAISESPRNPDVLWVGSDDGALWITRDGGQKWDNVYEKLGAPTGRWVATIEASRFVEGRAYVCLDAHRSDDDKPYLYVTEDFGKTWKSIVGNMPTFGSTRCLREDVVNKDLLLCGTEFAVFASIDRGVTWTKINNDLPTVAVHELAIHPTAGEVVAATHGRSLWIMDITPLRQMKPDVVKAAAHLFTPAPATKWRLEPARGTMYGAGAKKFFGTNPTNGATVYYAIGGKPEKVSLKVLDYAGQLVRDLPVKREPGMHKAQWNLTRPSAQALLAMQAGRALPEETMRRPGGFFGQSVGPGIYRIVLNVDGKEFSAPLVVDQDPNAPVGAIAVEWVDVTEEDKDDADGAGDGN